MFAISRGASNRAQKIVEFASQYCNWYVPGHSPKAPHEVPELGHYFKPNIEAFFCWVYDVPNQKIHRHLSIRCSSWDRPIPPATCYVLAEWFGFSGAVDDGNANHLPSTVMEGVEWVPNSVTQPGSDWTYQLYEEHATVILTQEIQHAEYSRFV